MELETIYIKGDSLAFKSFVDEHYKDKTIELRNIDGHNRWVVKNDDGTEMIARPGELVTKELAIKEKLALSGDGKFYFSQK